MNRKKHLKIAYFRFGLSLIVLIVCTMLNPLFNEWLCSDIEGYWTHAATFLGYDWSGAVRHVGYYYSWGYSLVLCIPMLVTDNFMVMNSIAIFLNALFCVIIMNLYFSLLKKIAAGIPESVILLIAFTASMYSGIIFMSTVSLAEIFIYLFVVIDLYLFFRYFQSEKILDLVLGGLAVGFTYIIHHRMIGVVMAAFLTVCLHSFKKKSIRPLILVFLSVGSMFLLDNAIAAFLLMKEKGGISNYEINTYGSVIGKIKNVFSVYGIISFMEGLIGACWYFLAAGFLINGFGLRFLFQKIRGNKPDRYAAWYVFVFLCLAFSVLVSIAFFWTGEPVDRNRIDTAFYGRYFEVFFPLFLCLGLTGLYGTAPENRNLSSAAIIFPVAAIFTVQLHYLTTAYGNSNINYHGVPGVLTTFFYPAWHFSVSASGTVAILGGAAVIVLLFHFNRQIKLAGILLLCFLFLHTGLNSSFNVSFKYKEEASVINNPTYNADFVQAMQYLDNCLSEEIWIITNNRMEPMSFQILFPSARITAVLSTETGLDGLEGIAVLAKTYIDAADFCGANQDKRIDTILDNDTYFICRLSHP